LNIFLQAAEDLYQAGFISYPRTETDKFSENQDLQGLCPHLNIHHYLSACASILDSIQLFMSYPIVGFAPQHISETGF